MEQITNFLIAAVSVGVVLGIMILVHEWGHFVAAKFFGVRVDIFSIGFGPRLWGRKRGDTDYRLSALPLGGYVKMAGDNPVEERTGDPDEFLSKPRWQRAIIAMAGPTVNILLALVLMTGLFMVGLPQPAYLDEPVVISTVMEGSPADVAGLRAGDRVVKIAGIEDPTWERALFEMLLTLPGKQIPVVVERDGERIPLTIEGLPADRAITGTFHAIGYPIQSVMVDTLTPGMPAESAGLATGDIIVLVSGQKIAGNLQFVESLQSAKGAPVEIVVLRGEQEKTLTVKPVMSESGRPRWLVGAGLVETARTVHRSFGLFPAAQRAAYFNLRLTGQILTVIAKLFQGEVSIKQLEGPVRIAQESGRAAQRGPADLVQFMALISLNLGILNLLPIPILDGGHLLMLSIEGMIRRDLSVTVKERFVQVGLVFLLLVFAIVMYNDVLKVFTR